MAYRFFNCEDLRMARLREQGVSHEQIVSEFYEDMQLMIDLTGSTAGSWRRSTCPTATVTSSS